MGRNITYKQPSKDGAFILFIFCLLAEDQTQGFVHAW
jgi:hypothetical protein